MSELRTRNGTYLFADQDDGSVVVYDLRRNRVAWVAAAYEAAQSPAPVPTAPQHPSSPAGPSLGLAPGVPFRVTDEQDGELLNRGYSYWPSVYIRDNDAYVFVGHADGHPRFFQVDLASGRIWPLGSLLPYTGTAEGWYWNQYGDIYLCDGPRLIRVNPFDHRDTDIAMDISQAHPVCRLNQAHSSDDGLVHSATIERIVSDGPYPRIGTSVVYHGARMTYPAQGVLDESQVDRSGEFLIIKEDDDNRIITLATGEARTIRDNDGAVGHSDCGAGFVVGEDNHLGACVRWNLGLPRNRQTLFGTWNMGHVSVRGGRCLLSDATHLSLVALDGSGVTPLLAHGMRPGGYDYQVHANLDPTGRVACYMSVVAGRLDVYLLVLPTENRT